MATDDAYGIRLGFFSKALEGDPHPLMLAGLEGEEALSRLFRFDLLLYRAAPALDRDALAHDVGDVLALDFQRLLLVDLLQLDLALAGDDLQLAGAIDLLDLDRDRALAILLGDFDFAHAVLFADVELLLGRDARLFGLQALPEAAARSQCRFPPEACEPLPVRLR